MLKKKIPHTTKAPDIPVKQDQNLRQATKMDVLYIPIGSMSGIYTYMDYGWFSYGKRR